MDTPWSAVQHVRSALVLPVLAIATLADLLAFLRASDDPGLRAHLASVQAYRDRYGVEADTGAGAA